MVDWRTGGWTGSINRLANQEVQAQVRSNPVAQRARYPAFDRALRAIFLRGSFMRFLVLYLMIAILTGLAETQSGTTLSFMPSWANRYDGAASRLLDDLPGFLIGAQVGLLGVISLALALISLIAQRDEASTDVQLYYHESLFFGLVASSLAFIFVLTVQFFWPVEFALNELHVAASNPSFRLFLLGIHAGWFGFNVIGILHFVGVTFRFVQRSEKQKIRERFTANVLLPQDIRRRLRTALYRSAGQNVWQPSGVETKPLIAFGSTLGEPYEPEITSEFRSDVQLEDVRVIILRWALRRWCARCAATKAATNQKGSTLLDQSPSLWFTPTLDKPLSKKVVWCRRRGGVPLSPIERLAIRIAFKFGRSKDAI